MRAHRAAKPLAALLLLMLYYVAGRAGLALAYIHTSASAVWAPTGIALAAMLLWGYRVWPVILLGAFLVNLSTSGSLPASLLIALGNLLEALTGAWLVKHATEGRHAFETPRNIVKFVLLGALAATTVSATIGVTSLVLTGLAHWTQYGPIWFTWWLGDATGAIIVTPVLVLCALPPVVAWNRQRYVEALLLLLALLLMCWFVFSGRSNMSLQNTPLAFLLLPLPVWAALRFSQREAALVCLLMSGLAVAGTLHGYGPFARSSPNESLMLLQGFIAVITITALFLAAEGSELKRSIETLQASEERARIVAEAASDAILTIDASSRILYANPATCAIFGYSMEELVGSNLANLMPELLRQRHRDALARYVASGQRQRPWTGIEFPGLHRDGRHLALEVSFGEFRQHGAHRFIGIVRDVSARKEAEQSQRLLAAIVESSDDAIIGKALDGTVLSWNRAAEQIYGFSANEMIGKPISRLIPEGRDEEHVSILAAIVRGEHVRHHETERLRKDGSLVPISLTISPIRSPNGSVVGASAISRDVSDRKAAEQRIHYLAQHDALTGLPNRMLCQDRIEQAITQAQRTGDQVAILFLDLDGFKHINDSLGHQVGDQVLQETARRLQQTLRGIDSVARLGGDEFIITLPAISSGSDAMPVADKILQALREPIQVGVHELHVSGSLGISLYPADGGDAATLMRAADSAMYHAKAMGRDHYQYFTPQLNDVVQRHLQLANLLHQALERRELLLHYQPQVNLEDGRIVAAEALLRWQQPQLGLIEPNEFINIAEDTGLIVPIGEWVLRSACQQLLRWRQNGHPHLCIAVNLSPQQVRYTGFVALTRQVLEETWLPASALCIDITEALFMAQNPQSIAVLEQLAELGVRLAIDNFGSGYASLACLQRFPIHALKIDQSFIHGIGSSRNDTAIVKAIIAMAHSLRLRVIGEGVETVEQAAFLKAQGCVDVQGFYCKEPLSEAAFDELLRVRVNASSRPDNVN